MANPSPAKPCPVCAKPAVEAYRPFCSKRCADVDLNRWLGENYVIAGEEPLGSHADDDAEDGAGWRNNGGTGS